MSAMYEGTCERVTVHCAVDGRVEVFSPSFVPSTPFGRRQPPPELQIIPSNQCLSIQMQIIPSNLQRR